LGGRERFEHARVFSASTEAARLVICAINLWFFPIGDALMPRVKRQSSFSCLKEIFYVLIFTPENPSLMIHSSRINIVLFRFDLDIDVSRRVAYLKKKATKTILTNKE
jgi:hypothetical protein